MKLFTLTLFAALALAGCTSAPKSSTAGPAAKPAPDLITGQIALGRMNLPAHLWAADIQPVRLESQPTKDADGAGGKSAFWRSEWVSATKSAAKDFTWSGSDASDQDASSRGLSAGSESPWSPANTSMSPFNNGFLKVDSDKAYSAAKAKLPPKAKATPVKYTLSFDARKNQLVWRVIFGDTDPVILDVDATTGAYLRTEH